MLDEYLFNMGQSRDTSGDEREERARTEKTAALKELAESKISVLVGDAGTGKTTVLAVLCIMESLIISYWHSPQITHLAVLTILLIL